MHARARLVYISQELEFELVTSIKIWARLGSARQGKILVRARAQAQSLAECVGVATYG